MVSIYTFLLILLLSSTMGCESGGSNLPSTPCTIGEQQQCTCLNQTLGVTNCQNNGLFGPCEQCMNSIGTIEAGNDGSSSYPSPSTSVSGGGGASGAISSGGNMTAGSGVGGTSTAGIGSIDISSGTGATSGSPSSGTGGEEMEGIGGAPSTVDRFSFFVTSLEGLMMLANGQYGFGGDLRYGEADGLSGADKICMELAENSMKGAGQKQWRAFLSVTKGPDGGPVNAIDRIGEGPWYDRLGRILAENKSALANERPLGADPEIINDLPNEFGVPNHRPDPGQGEVDNHHVLTGSDGQGRLYSTNPSSTCNDWTTTVASAGRPRIGVSWPAQRRSHWISQMDEGGCAVSTPQDIIESGGSSGRIGTVGSGGGYGGFYCFALTP